jgi:hypothetical protein
MNRKLGYTASAPLAIVKSTDQAGHTTIPSLAVQCYIAQSGGDPGKNETVQLDPYQRELLIHLPQPPAGPGTRAFRCFDLAWPVRTAQKACPIIARGDIHAALALDLSPLDRIRSRTTTLKYEDVLEADADSLGSLKHKVVLIGVVHPDDEFQVHWRLHPEWRHGVELHADALNALLQGKPIREPEFLTKLALVLGMYFLGAFVRTRLHKRRAFWHVGAFAALFAAYLILAMYCYAQFRILLSLLDGFLAFALSFWAVGVIRRKWFT